MFDYDFISTHAVLLIYRLYSITHVARVKTVSCHWINVKFI